MRRAMSWLRTAAVDQVARIRAPMTPTLGRERSFLEDLFGNIGAVGAPGVGGQQQ